MADVQDKVVEFPSSVSEAYDSYLEAKAVEARAKKEKEGLLSFIIQSVPLDMKDDESRSYGIKDGVKVLAFNRTSTKWKQALEKIVETLLPHIRVPKAERIIDKFTSCREQYSITLPEE